MAELADAPDLGSGVERHGGSSPSKCIPMVDVAQSVRASDCDSEGCGFDSRHSPFAAIAQSVEHHFGKVEVTSSILVGSLRLNSSTG